MSTLVTGNITVAGRRTSVRLEPAMWDALAEVCRREGTTLHDIGTRVARVQRSSSLTAALRVFIVGYYRDAATEEGHHLAGHGRRGAGFGGWGQRVEATQPVSLPAGQPVRRNAPAIAS